MRSSVHTDHTEEGGSRKKQAERKGGRRDTLAGEMSCSDYVFLTNMAPARSLTKQERERKTGKKGDQWRARNGWGWGRRLDTLTKWRRLASLTKRRARLGRQKKNNSSQLLPGSFRVAATDAAFWLRALLCLAVVIRYRKGFPACHWLTPPRARCPLGALGGKKKEKRESEKRARPHGNGAIALGGD